MRIGSVEVENQVVSAPMAGVSDKAFRILAREFGAGLVYTEMISAKGLVYSDSKTLKLLDTAGESGPTVVQIFGTEPRVMSEGAVIAERAGADIIDINMGCPTPKIYKNGAGCALMEHLELAVEIAASVVKSVDAPVSVKMRKGASDDLVNAAELAREVERVGVSAVAVHGRLQTQFYSGRSDWSTIADVKNTVGVPVIGNGDIREPEDAQMMLYKTGCDAVMIARGARGNPWVFKRTLSYLNEGRLPPKPRSFERLETAIRHLQLAAKYKDEKTALLEMRKHLSWYIKGLRGAAKMRDKINKTEELSTLFELLEEYKSKFR